MTVTSARAHPLRGGDGAMASGCGGSGGDAATCNDGDGGDDDGGVLRADECPRRVGTAPNRAWFFVSFPGGLVSSEAAPEVVSRHLMNVPSTGPTLMTPAGGVKVWRDQVDLRNCAPSCNRTTVRGGDTIGFTFSRAQRGTEWETNQRPNGKRKGFERLKEEILRRTEVRRYHFHYRIDR